MPRLAATATVTTTTEVRLEPKVRQKLLTKLRTYAGKKAQLDALKAEMESLNTEIEDIRCDIGEEKVELEGFSVKLVAGTHSKFNPNKFVAAGGDLAIYNQSVEIKPKKAFTKITCPGAKEEE
jgi:hypothetical protein